MSRGPGRLQRAILETLAASHGGPLPYFVGAEYQVGEQLDVDLRRAVFGTRQLTDPQHTRFRRAADGLCRLGYVSQRVAREGHHSFCLWSLTVAGLEYANGVGVCDGRHSLTPADLAARDAAIDSQFAARQAACVAAFAELGREIDQSALRSVVRACERMSRGDLLSLAAHIQALLGESR